MATTSLSRTPGSTGDPKTFTFSTWLKVSKIQEQMFFTCGVYLSTSLMQFYLNANGTLTLSQEDSSGSGQSNLTTTQVFRDTSAFYHICVAVDTTQAVSSNRVKLYVNGTQVTDFTTETYPSLNLDFACNTSSVINMIGNRSGGSFQYDGLMSNTALVDGTALAPTSFGEVDSTSGIWKFLPPSGITWGTNGFWLKGENSAALGTDSSGNTNTFAVASGTPTQSIDTPSNVYCTWNPLAQPTGTLSNGNLSVSGVQDTPGTLGVTTGKWYWEYKRTNTTNSLHWGICSTKNGFNLTSNQLLNGESNSVGGAIYVSETGLGTTGYANAGGFSSTSYSGVSTPSISNGDIVGCALDISTSSGTLEWFNNGVSFGSATFTYDDSVSVYPFVRQNSGSTGDVNFGTGYFGTTAISSAGTSSTGDDSVWEYNCPANHYGLSTKNINTYG